MRRLVVLALPVATLAVLGAGCGDSSPSVSPAPPPPPATTPPPPAPPPAPPPRPWRSFGKQELRTIALQPKDAPAELVFLPDESGSRTLGEVLYLPSQQREARSKGFVGGFDSTFAAKSQTSDRRVAQRIWLFRQPRGAKAWLAKTKQDAIALQFDELEAPLLGEESWAAHGLIQIGGGQAITHAFRLGNAVFTIVMYGERTAPSEAGALAAAKAALARAKAAG